ncbi:hypothetical protein VPHK436_0026 [Vibrio phage K436]
MDTIKPLMVGRNANAAPVQQEAGLQMSSQPALAASVPATPAFVPAQAQEQTPVFNPLQAQVQAAAPVQAAPAQVAAPVQAVQAASGCSMYFDIKQVTKLELEMPWGFINEKFEVAFISSYGELVVSELPPLIDRTNDIFVLEDGVASLVIGRVQPEHQLHWRESISFRPDSEYANDEVHEVVAAAPVVEPTPAPVVPKLEDTVDYSAMSRNQRKKQKKAMLARGVKFDDLPEALRNA